MLRFAAAVICLLGLSQSAGAADGGCIRLVKGVPGVHVIPGRFDHGRSFIVSMRAPVSACGSTSSPLGV